MANIADILLQTSQPKVIFKTQLTPDITFSLVPGKKPEVEAVEPTASGRFGAWILEHIIKPEVQITAAGLSQSYAPFGSPKENYALPLAIGIGAGALTVGGILLLMSRKRK